MKKEKLKDLYNNGNELKFPNPKVEWNYFKDMTVKEFANLFNKSDFKHRNPKHYEACKYGMVVICKDGYYDRRKDNSDRRKLFNEDLGYCFEGIWCQEEI